MVMGSWETFDFVLDILEVAFEGRVELDIFLILWEVGEG
jgi:hypothetical protein